MKSQTKYTGGVQSQGRLLYASFMNKSGAGDIPDQTKRVMK